MSLPPGLLPESNEPLPRARATMLLGAVVFVALLAIVALLIQNRRLAWERDGALRRVSLPPPAGRAPLAPAEAVKPGPPDVAPPPEPAAVPAAVAVSPKVRVLPEDPEYLTRGLQEFRQGRYDQAERQFFRAIPDSFLYLALTALAQHNWREALAFLTRAMTADPAWLRRVDPRALFGSDAAFDGVLEALDEQISKNPIDADLKTLAAYLRYHVKGAAYAKALLIEATNVKPDHEAAKTFLEALGP